MKCYLEQEDYKEALVHGYKAKDLLRFPYSDTPQAVIVLAVIGEVYEKTNNFDSALYYLQKSYRLTNLFWEVPLTFGDIYAKKENYDSALYYYKEGATICQKNLTYTGLIDIYSSMSKIYAAMGRQDSAIYYAYRAFLQQGIQVYPEGKLKAAILLANLYEIKRESRQHN